jgi:small subunit ribosomal protein S16
VILISEPWRCILLSIRLTRRGAKKKPFYRIIVTETRSKRDGRFLENVGYYDPCRSPAEIKIDRDRVKYWMERGAQPSETVRSLIKRKIEPAVAEATA